MIFCICQGGIPPFRFRATRGHHSLPCRKAVDGSEMRPADSAAAISLARRPGARIMWSKQRTRVAPGQPFFTVASTRGKNSFWTTSASKRFNLSVSPLQTVPPTKDEKQYNQDVENGQHQTQRWTVFFSPSVVEAKKVKAAY